MPNDNAAFRIARARWRRKSVLGVKDEKFWPITQEVIDAMLDPELEREWLEFNPQYHAMREILERQEKAVEELIASGNLQDPEWIKQNVHVLTDDEVVKNEVYAWLNDYLKTPEGQKNLARALVSEIGGSDNQIKIKFGSVKSLNGAGGWASSRRSRIQLSKENWQRNCVHESCFVLPHEMRHLGQEGACSLSQREYFLYHVGLVEADARLTEYCDGITEGRNQDYRGYRGLKQDFKAVLQELGEKSVKSFEDFEQLRETDRKKYDLIMGRLKEREFSEVLNHLSQMPIYLRQGSGVVWRSGKGNLPALRAWCEDMCERQGMRFEKVWPEIGAMATGQKEIPGMEGGFDAEGKLTQRGRDILSKAKKLDMSPREIIRSQETGKIIREIKCLDTGETEEVFYDENERVIKKVERDADGDESYSIVYTRNEKGDVIKSKETYEDGATEETDYDEAEIPVHSISINNGKKVESQYKLYGRNILPIETVETDANEVTTIRYSYDNAGHCLSRTYTYPGKGISHLEWTYHKNGKKASTISVSKDAKGKEIGRVERFFDEQGHPIEAKIKGNENKGQVENTTDTDATEEASASASVTPNVDFSTKGDKVQEIEEGLEPKVSLQNGQENPEKQKIVENSHRRRTADKTPDKPYYGHREGGIDDLIAKVDGRERARMSSACDRKKLTHS